MVDVNLVARLRDEAFESMPRMALIIARKGRLVTANRRTRDVVQNFEDLQQDEINIETIFKGERARLISDVVAAASGGMLYWFLYGSNGDEPLRTNFLVHAIKIAQSASHFMLIEDVEKPIKRAFEEINSRLRAANEAAAEARDENRQLQRRYREVEGFSHRAAHDLRAPLRHITMLLDGIRENLQGRLADQFSTELSMVTQSTKRLGNLISALLSHAKSNTVQLTKEQVGVSEVINDITDNLSGLIQMAGAKVVFDANVGTVAADRLFFQQLLDNLIGNAIKYRCPERSLIVKIERVANEDDTDSLLINDNGVGFESELSDKLFEPFERFHFQSEIEGSGIGLATCRSICDRHKWTISAQGEKGVGSQFRISGIEQN